MLGLVKKNPNYYAKIKNQVLVVMDTTSPENAYYELEGAYIDLWNLIDGKNNALAAPIFAFAATSCCSA